MQKNFCGNFLEKLKQFSGRGSKMDCLQKEGVSLWKFLTYYINIVNCQIMPTPLALASKYLEKLKERNNGK